MGSEEITTARATVGEASREMAADTIMTRILKQQHICSVFHHDSTVTGGVFIAQKLNYSPAKIPLLPPNRQHLGIFPGKNRNVTTLDTTQWNYSCTLRTKF